MGTFNKAMHRATFIIYLGVAFAASLWTLSFGNPDKTKDGFLNFEPVSLDLSKIPQKQGNKSNASSASRLICCDYCIFPFKYSGREFQMCTNMYNDDYICATEVDSNGNLIEWDYCDPCCKGASPETTPQMEYNEANSKGHCHCGVINPYDKYEKIVGGQNSYIGMMPWQVAILFNGPELYNQGCGGTIVGDKYIVTAAHCTDGVTINDLFVRVGDTILGTEFEAEAFTYDVCEIIQHPGFSWSTFENDISILRLCDPVPLYDYPNIKPACLPSFEYSGPGIVSGWGTVYSGGYLMSWLQDVDVYVFPNVDCGLMTDYMDYSMLCAGYMDGGKDACQGDSGGPLIANFNPWPQSSYTLTGVVSWGYGCAAPDYLGIYANVSHFTGWLYDNMPELNTCPPIDYIIETTEPTFNTWPTSSDPCMPPPVCNKKNTINNFKTFKTIKKVDSKEDCNEICKYYEGDECEFWNFKDNKKKSKRVCYLIKNEPKKKKNYFSGARGCIFL